MTLALWSGFVADEFGLGARVFDAGGHLELAGRARGLLLLSIAA
jgi:hypothetical protein